MLLWSNKHYWRAACLRHLSYNDYSSKTPLFQCLNLPESLLDGLCVEHLDILTDEVSPSHYKESEDLHTFKSKKTGRGPLESGLYLRPKVTV